ncbi:MAG: hypothetical protein E2582_08885 [Delftia sp.]|uniref:Asp/Glu/Hydantoin racemase n=1 Tax=Delftia lacustris TaxID=558537 RepID=A0A7T2YPH1_9BURK|nr:MULTISPECIES: hypothetical protein [Delftia]EPD35347.1 hypothetical protein HMPREF9702_05965 [Delftia acidovorans CCUG 15835]KAA9170557.1 hypothetical protein F3K36_19590 [Delftia sp. BR1]MPT04326.1 hypothetical protein [Delftia sp.]QPS79557.1 hypothetical protein I6G47_21355 [Delftia lacustris]
MPILCLHTAHSNAVIFEQAAAELGWPAHSIVHQVHEELLLEAEAAGGMDAALRRKTARQLDALADPADIDAVLLTCSTLGPAVADCLSDKVWRADGMLARKVAAALQRDLQSRIALLCAAPTTYEATRDLFMQALLPGDAHLRLQLQCVEGAWALFRRGDLSGYQARMTDAAFQAYAAGAAQVVLTQVSMDGVARYWQARDSHPVPWTVAASALQALGEMRK